MFFKTVTVDYIKQNETTNKQKSLSQAKENRILKKISQSPIAFVKVSLLIEQKTSIDKEN
jgi:hypothetical protein